MTIADRLHALSIDHGPNGVDEDVLELLERHEQLLEATAELVHHVKKLPREWWGPVPALVRRIDAAEKLLKRGSAR